MLGADSNDSSNLPAAIKPDFLVYQNRQLLQTCKELKHQVKNLSNTSNIKAVVDEMVRTTSGNDRATFTRLLSILEEPRDADDSVTESTVEAMRDQIKHLTEVLGTYANDVENLKEEKKILYTKLHRVHAKLVTQPPPSAAPVASVRPDEDQDDPGSKPAGNPEEVENLRKLIVTFQTQLALLKSNNRQPSGTDSTVPRKTLLELKADRDFWAMRCDKIEKTNFEFNLNFNKKLSEIDEIKMKNENEYSNGVSRISEELAQNYNEIKKLKSQIDEKDQMAKQVSTVPTLTAALTPEDSDDIIRIKTEYGRLRDQLKVKEEQCQRLLGQTLHYKHLLNSKDTELALLRGRDGEVSEVIRATEAFKADVDSRRDAEIKLRENLEHEKLHLKILNSNLLKELSEWQSRVNSANELIEKYNKTIEELQQRLRNAQIENEQIRRTKQSTNGSLAEAELQDLQKLIKCNLCQERRKSVVISSCMHCFCRECVNRDMIQARNRKCPFCGQKFAEAEVRDIHFLI
jgi:chromosome segregation ATPase